MIGDGHGDRAGRFAAELIVQAVWPAAVVLAVLLFAPFATFAGAAPDGALLIPAIVLAALSGLGTLWLSLVLLFDALLFHLMASHENEIAGGAAVDDLLARLRLKTAPASVRSLDSRMAGTRGLLAKQRAALGLFAVSAIFAAFLDRAYG